MAAVLLACLAMLTTTLAYERSNDFGNADVSGANTFWNVSGYNGGSVCRAASDVIEGFDSRYYTKSATLKFGYYLNRGTLIMIF